MGGFGVNVLLMFASWLIREAAARLPSMPVEYNPKAEDLLEVEKGGSGIVNTYISFDYGTGKETSHVLKVFMDNSYMKEEEAVTLLSDSIGESDSVDESYKRASVLENVGIIVPYARTVLKQETAAPSSEGLENERVALVLFPTAGEVMDFYYFVVRDKKVDGELLEKFHAIMEGVIGALIHLHGKELVHGNIKAEHILFTTGALPTRGYIIDMGTLGKPGPLVKEMTRSIMPAEVLDSGLVSEDTDIYSLGVTMMFGFEPLVLIGNERSPCLTYFSVADYFFSSRQQEGITSIDLYVLGFSMRGGMFRQILQRLFEMTGMKSYLIMMELAMSVKIARPSAQILNEYLSGDENNRQDIIRSHVEKWLRMEEDDARRYLAREPCDMIKTLKDIKLLPERGKEGLTIWETKPSKYNLRSLVTHLEENSITVPRQLFAAAAFTTLTSDSLIDAFVQSPGKFVRSPLGSELRQKLGHLSEPDAQLIAVIFC